ncbi:MAG: LysR family transcriptional regulator, partial [Curvibacter sp.]|nr:LysR family transcriptional regulator [Curvibacter sp.]
MNIPLDNLSDMAVFTRVVELGHFSAVAREMHQTPSAVSRQIGRLERLLGMRLFERSTRKLRLTEAGAAVYEQCRSLVSAAREVVALRDSQQAVPHGLLRVSCPKAVARQILHPLMPAFLARYPEVDVQLIVTDRQVDLFEEAVDLAVCITEAPPAGLSGRPLMAVGHGVFATPRYLADKGAPAHPDELARHSCIYLGE